MDDFQELNERVKKITEALYRVTDLFPEEEPLKWTMRRKAAEIFSRLIELKTAPVYQQTRNLERAVDNISRLIDFLELASASSFISRLNFEVLKREYSALREFVKTRKEEFLPYEPVLLDQPLKPAHSSKGQSQGQENNNKGQIEKNNVLYNSSEKPANNIIDMPNNISQRKKEILFLISDKGWTSIKDIVQTFQEKGIGPKTVQRELIALVSQGLLKTQGQRRWRKYGLKNTPT